MQKNVQDFPPVVCWNFVRIRSSGGYLPFTNAGPQTTARIL